MTVRASLRRREGSSHDRFTKFTPLPWLAGFKPTITAASSKRFDAGVSKSHAATDASLDGRRKIAVKPVLIADYA